MVRFYVFFVNKNSLKLTEDQINHAGFADWLLSGILTDQSPGAKQEVTHVHK